MNISDITATIECLLESVIAINEELKASCDEYLAEVRNLSLNSRREYVANKIAADMNNKYTQIAEIMDQNDPITAPALEAWISIVDRMIVRVLDEIR